MNDDDNVEEMSLPGLRLFQTEFRLTVLHVLTFKTDINDSFYITFEELWESITSFAIVSYQYVFGISDLATSS